MSSPLSRLLIGAALAALIAFAAYRARSLARSGAFMATLVGALACAAGWRWGFTLIAFFTSSTLLSRWRKRAKEAATEAIVEKGGARDAWQVVANGGAFAAAAALEAWHPELRWGLAGLGALAAATADTWATEIGTAFGGVPRHVLTWRALPPGTSGGVSLAGTAAMCAGAIFLGTVARATGFPQGVLAPVVAGGIVGALADTLAGATMQERRWCPSCARGTERHVHDCGSATTIAGGIPGMTNDLVNLTSCLVGAVTAVAWGSAWA